MKMRRNITVLALAVSALVALSHAADNGSFLSHEAKLHQDLMGRNYVRQVRPVRNASETVLVKLFPWIVRLEDIDEHQGTMASTISLTQSWNDPRLTWDPQNYGNVTVMRFSADDVWKPDLELYNVAPDSKGSFYDGLVVVRNTGDVMLIPYYNIRTYCSLDLANFPHDTQDCKITFGSWAHSSKEIMIEFWSDNTTSMTVGVFGDGELAYESHSHPSWELVGGKGTGSIRRLKFGCCPELYEVMDIDLSLRRRSQFFQFLAVGPAVTIAMLMPMQFLLPVQSSQRTSFGLLIIVCILILMMTLQDSIPVQHSTVPRIGVFYVVVMFLSGLAVLISSALNGIASGGKRRRGLPNWINQMFLRRKWIRCFFCVDDPSPVSSMYNSLNTRLLEDAGEPHLEEQGPGTREREMDTYAEASGPDVHMRSIAKSTKVIAEKVVTDDALEKITQEWQRFAKLLNNIFFCVFVVVLVITALALLPHAAFP